MYIKNLLDKEKFAFTLAEVLITLGIIGIVAAMTIPTLIRNYQEKELVSRWLRVYSLLTQAYQSLQYEYGDFNKWHNTDAEDVYEKFKEKMKYSADCPKGTSNNSCFPIDVQYSDLTGTVLGSGAILANLEQYPAIRLVTGESILFYNPSNIVDILVDLNGNSGPNKMGVDLFYFSLGKEIKKSEIVDGATVTVVVGVSDTQRVRPSAHYDWVDNYTLCDPNAQSAIWTKGASCGFWIQRYRNMDYLELTSSEISAKWGTRLWD